MQRRTLIQHSLASALLLGTAFIVLVVVRRSKARR